MTEATHPIEGVQPSNAGVAGPLLPQVYAELRKLAACRMTQEAPGNTLQATALVHEAWIRLGADAQPAWENRAHFFAAAGEAMRRILVESARRKKCRKHGGGLERLDADEVDIPLPMPEDELLGLHDALDRLAAVDSRAAELVKLRFFVGLTQEQAARELDVSLSTAERLWSFARAWLFRELHTGREPAT